MKEVQIKAILGIVDPYDNGSPKITEYDFNTSLKVKSTAKHDIDNSVTNFITESEKKIGGTCAYGVVQVYKSNLLIADITIQHEAVKEEDDNVTMH
jgi:hypothetical protein